MENVFDFLKGLGIEYQVFNHPAVFTVEESQRHRLDIEFGENKNLFLRNKKGDRHYLVVISASKQLDLKKFSEKLDEKNIGFASPDRLLKYLKLTPGSVSPFGLLNDIERKVELIIDKDLLENEMLGFHPNINTQTLVLK